MFSKYKIINKNNEEILILYMDYYMEFSIDFSGKNKSNNLKNEIRKAIRNTKFNGTKIVLSIGGIILATLLVIKEPIIDSDMIYVNSNILPKNEVVEIENEEEREVIDDVVIEDKEEIEVKKEIPINKSQEVSSYTSNIQKPLENINTSQSIIQEEKVKVIEEPKQEEKMVTIYRNDGSIITLELEEYLIGVVGAEMPASFNIEALKVQAIISRTYALRSLEIGRRLTDDVKTQAYKDNNQLRNMWGNDYDKYYNKIKEAVGSTKGIAIYYDNKYIDALFFSCSNGKTEDSKYVWGNSVPYLKSVDSSWDIGTTPYLRETEKELDSILNLFGIDTFSYSILSRDASGRVLEIMVGDKIYSGVEFRNLLGLRSADFDIEINDNNVKIITRGYGHGVGLSQYGANGMAKDGYNFIDIIKHYYISVEVR